MTLQGRPADPVFVKKPAILDARNMQLMVSVTAEEQYHLVFNELSRLFCYGSVDEDLVNFMVRMAYERDNTSVDAHFGELDPDVPVWEVKKMEVLPQLEGSSQTAWQTGSFAGGSDEAQEMEKKKAADRKKKRETTKQPAWAPEEQWPEVELDRQQQLPAQTPVGILPEHLRRSEASPNPSVLAPLVSSGPLLKHQQQNDGNRHQANKAPGHDPEHRKQHQGSYYGAPGLDAGMSSATTGGHGGGSGIGIGGVNAAEKIELMSLKLEELHAVPLELSGLQSSTVADLLPSSLLDSDKQEVGRHGELLVFHWLKKQPRCQGATVEWMNEGSESNLPYDLFVTWPEGSPQGSGVEYVEVKTSSVAEKGNFEVSLRELKYAEEYGASYVICRVSGVGVSRPMLTEIRDPALQIKAGKVSLMVVADSAAQLQQ